MVKCEVCGKEHRCRAVRATAIRKDEVVAELLNSGFVTTADKIAPKPDDRIESVETAQERQQRLYIEKIEGRHKR